MLWFSCSCAATAAAHTEIDIQDLPNLPGSDLPPPLHWQLDEQSAALTYETRSKKWEAKIDQSSDGDTSVAVDYGVLLTNKLSAGTTFARQADYSEIVANAVYAHRRNIRFRLAGALLRTMGSSLPDSYGDAFTLRQNSYLFSARKYWPEKRFVSNLGLALYRVNATPSAPSLLSSLAQAQALDSDEDHPVNHTSGKLDGFMLNLGLRPTWQSKIELRHEFSHINYRPYSDLPQSEFLSSSRISYQQYFGNCMRLRGGYNASRDEGRLDLSLAKDNWSVKLSQAFNDFGHDTALQFSVNIPLDGKVSPSTGCGMQREPAPSFAPIVEAALQRPQQFPREPITAIAAQ